MTSCGLPHRIAQDMENLSWYHPTANRHVAESMLRSNGVDGTYLLRPSSIPGELALSLRCKDSVKHFPVKCNNDKYHFGMASFKTLADFVKHFENHPLVASESGVLQLLKFPYPRDIQEPGIYDELRVHAEFGRHMSTKKPQHFSSVSKEGFLTKLGGNVKNWKTRWFVLNRNELKYFKTRDDSTPIKTLDLYECMECSKDTSHGKENCFKIVFEWRTFYMYSTTLEEAKEWMEVLEWLLSHLKERK